MNDDLNFWDVYEPEWSSACKFLFENKSPTWKTNMLVLAAQHMRKVSPLLAKQRAGLDANILGADMEAWLQEFES